MPVDEKDADIYQRILKDTIPKFNEHAGAYLFIWDGLPWHDDQRNLAMHTIIAIPYAFVDLNDTESSIDEWLMDAENGSARLFENLQSEHGQRRCLLKRSENELVLINEPGTSPGLSCGNREGLFINLHLDVEADGITYHRTGEFSQNGRMDDVINTLELECSQRKSA